MGMSIKSEQHGASRFSCRIGALRFLALRFFKVLFAPLSQQVAVLAQVSLFVPPKQNGDNVEMRGEGCLIGPAPAIAALLSGMQDHVLREVIMPGIAEGAGKALFAALREAKGESPTAPTQVVH